jgi:flagellar motor protein MotB/flagellar basal body-associated protein FliL
MSATSSRRRKRHEEEHVEHENEERWLVSFADMMTLLFCLFMVLFAISSVNVSKVEELQKSLTDSLSGPVLTGGRALIERGATQQNQRPSSRPAVPSLMPADAVKSSMTKSKLEAAAAAAKREQASFRALKKRIDAEAQKLGLAAKVRTDIRERGLVVRLLTDGVFFDSGQAELKPAAGPILRRLGKVLRLERSHPLVVEGYTDSQPIQSGRFPSNWELSGARASGVVRHFIGSGVPVGATQHGRVRPTASRRQERHARRAFREPSGRGRPRPHEQDTGPGRGGAMKKKLMIVIPILLIVLGGAYKFVLAKPAEAKPEPKVHGSVYVLGKEFLINLADGHYAKLTVGLVLSHDDTSTVVEGGGHGAAPAPPEGFGPMAQEAVVRDVITDELTGAGEKALVDPEIREEIKAHITKKLLKKTDVKVEEVLFTDVTVQ